MKKKPYKFKGYLMWFYSKKQTNKKTFPHTSMSLTVGAVKKDKAGELMLIQANWKEVSSLWSEENKLKLIILEHTCFWSWFNVPCATKKKDFVKSFEVDHKMA